MVQPKSLCSFVSIGWPLANHCASFWKALFTSKGHNCPIPHCHTHGRAWVWSSPRNTQSPCTTCIIVEYTALAAQPNGSMAPSDLPLTSAPAMLKAYPSTCVFSQWWSLSICGFVIIRLLLSAASNH